MMGTSINRLSVVRCNGKTVGVVIPMANQRMGTDIPLFQGTPWIC